MKTSDSSFWKCMNSLGHQDSVAQSPEPEAVSRTQKQNIALATQSCATIRDYTDLSALKRTWIFKGVEGLWYSLHRLGYSVRKALFLSP